MRRPFGHATLLDGRVFRAAESLGRFAIARHLYVPNVKLSREVASQIIRLVR